MEQLAREKSIPTFTGFHWQMTEQDFLCRWNLDMEKLATSIPQTGGGGILQQYVFKQVYGRGRVFTCQICLNYQYHHNCLLPLPQTRWCSAPPDSSWHWRSHHSLQGVGIVRIASEKLRVVPHQGCRPQFHQARTCRAAREKGRRVCYKQVKSKLGHAYYSLSIGHELRNAESRTGLPYPPMPFSPPLLLSLESLDEPLLLPLPLLYLFLLFFLLFFSFLCFCMQYNAIKKLSIHYPHRLAVALHDFQ